MNTKVFYVYGNKLTKREPADHRIDFPGGDIAITRTSDDEYWVHISVNRGQVVKDAGSYLSKPGQIVGSRIDYEHPTCQEKDIPELPGQADIEHLAIRIATT